MITIVLRAVALVAAALNLAAPVFAQSSSAPPTIMREFRGAWVASVANIDWPSRPGLSSWQQKSELIAILDRAVELNLNAVLLQVRPAADALYDSPYEPWSEYLTGRQGAAPEPYYDPLRFAVAEAHARGLELHAWFNPYRARHPSAKGAESRTHISVAHPELVRSYGRYLWMDPGEPAVIQQSLRVMLDVVRRYDVDGIHIDDYFYPYPELGADSVAIPFPDSASYAAYAKRGGRLARDDWRRHNVDTLIQQLYVRTKALKPWVKVGISPFGIWRPGYPAQITGFDSFAKLYGDSRLWLREGWADYFTPQLYWPIGQTAQSYTTLLHWWLGENIKQRHMWPGHNTSRAGLGVWAPDELNRQILVTRASGATGDIHFSMRALMPLGTVRRDSVLVGVATPPPRPAAAALIAERLRAELYPSTALVPASPWLSTRQPARPSGTITNDPATGDVVLRITSVSRDARWLTVRVRTADGWRSHVLPAGQTRLVLASASARPSRVVIGAVDRFGTESAPYEVR